VGHLLENKKSRKSVTVAERFADGLVNEDQRNTAHAGARLAFPYSTDGIAQYLAATAAYWVSHAVAMNHVAAVAERAGSAANRTFQSDTGSPPLLIQCELLRDIFGNPFHPPARIDPSALLWNEGFVVEWANAIYEERQFEDLPDLADALENAGCHDQDVLRHCRQKGAEHVRGCWVVDALLGKG
jgi:hypothetical protein